MSHLFRYPTAGAPTATVTLRPSLVTIQEELIEPIQRALEAADGTQWIYALSANRRQTFTVLVEDLQEADAAGFSGYASLKAFFESSTNWMQSQFDLTHEDGITTTVRLLQDRWAFRETIKGYWSGEFLLRKRF